MVREPLALVGFAWGVAGWHLYQTVVVAIQRMETLSQDLQLDGVPIARLESQFLRLDVAPSVGGRMVSLVDKRTGHEFLWRNRSLKLELLPTGSEYDPNFYGGIDELLPNDPAEKIAGIDCPDHGELWTTSLSSRIEGQTLSLRGKLPWFGLEYERKMSLRKDEPIVELWYRITNRTEAAREFLWKLHAALAVRAGDIIDCPARQAQVVDPAWSRFKSTAPFVWPRIEGKDASVIPPLDGTMDFFYLFNLERGEMSWRRPESGLRFTYQFDKNIFPYAWLFASYGGFNGHYTIILEPCTAMPMSVIESAQKNQCSRLDPGEQIETTVKIFAGVEGAA
jgi:hypothetical protein